MQTTNFHSTPIVFAGLTLSEAEVRAVVSAEIRPPIMRGDLDQLESNRLVAIIDGELEPKAMLPSNEVLRAIERGSHVLGTASLGALRAFELRDKGMTGVGWVYKAYCTGLIAGPDEIAVTYDRLFRQPLTIPLINVRFCLDDLARCGRITAQDLVIAMNALKGLAVEERTQRIVLLRLVEIFGRDLVKAELRRLPRSNPNIKKRDAYRLLQTLDREYEPRRNWC